MEKVSFPAGEAGVRSTDRVGLTGPMSSCDCDHSLPATKDPEERVAGRSAGARVLWGNKSAKMRAPTQRTVRFSTADDDRRPCGGRGSLGSRSVDIYTPVRRVLPRLGFRACVSGLVAVVCAGITGSLDSGGSSEVLPFEH